MSFQLKTSSSRSILSPFSILQLQRFPTQLTFTTRRQDHTPIQVNKSTKALERRNAYNRSRSRNASITAIIGQHSSLQIPARIHDAVTRGRVGDNTSRTGSRPDETAPVQRIPSIESLFRWLLSLLSSLRTRHSQFVDAGTRGLGRRAKIHAMGTKKLKHSDTLGLHRSLDRFYPFYRRSTFVARRIPGSVHNSEVGDLQPCHPHTRKLEVSETLRFESLFRSILSRLWLLSSSNTCHTSMAANTCRSRGGGRLYRHDPHTRELENSMTLDLSRSFGRIYRFYRFYHRSPLVHTSIPASFHRFARGYDPARPEPVPNEAQTQQYTPFESLSQLHLVSPYALRTIGSIYGHRSLFHGRCGRGAGNTGLHLVLPSKYHYSACRRLTEGY